MEITKKQRQWHLILFLIFLAFLIWSAINPKDYTVWWLEVAPALIGYAILIFTYKRCPLTTLSYFWVCFFAIILLIGGHYTYSEVPFFEIFKQEPFNATRNHFDRFGHIFQGVTPAILARELLLRTSPLKPGKWLFWIVLSIALAISATYELLEWVTAMQADEAGIAFVGAQGDFWDAQKDMALCLLGAFIAQVCFNRWHSRQIRQITGRTDI